MRVFACQYREHTGRRLRRYGVDRPENRMRVRRAQHHGMRETGEGEIVEIASPASDEPQILPALGPVANDGAHCRHLYPWVRCEFRHEPAAAAISRNSSGNSRPPPIRSRPSFTSMSCATTRRNWGTMATPWPPYPSAI